MREGVSVTTGLYEYGDLKATGKASSPLWNVCMILCGSRQCAMAVWSQDGLGLFCPILIPFLYTNASLASCKTCS